MMQSEQTVSAGAQQAARAGCIDMLFGETRTEAGVGAVMSVTAAAILWAPDTQGMLLGWLGWMAALYGVRLGCVGVISDRLRETPEPRSGRSCSRWAWPAPS
jgi:hypothetical protein